MKKALDFFKKTHNKKRLSHLYLISGEQGTGKLRLAYEFCHMLLKEYDSNESLLENISNNNHPQVYYIEPDGLSIKKSQIMTLQDEFSKTTLYKGPRIYIVNDADLISSGAANSLLKFMEEPESNEVYGLLLTSNIGSILPTITSRSQIITLQSLSHQILKTNLINEGLDERKATNIAYITRSLDEGIILSENEQFESIVNFLENLIRNWNDPSKSISLMFMQDLEFLFYERSLYQTLLELMLLYFLDIIRYKTNQKINLMHLKEDIQQISHKLTIKQLNDITTSIKEEIVKQTYYINISLSIDALALELEKNR